MQWKRVSAEWMEREDVCAQKQSFYLVFLSVFGSDDVICATSL